jgi:hypothetical protein
MKQLFNIISAFAYHISILVYITIIVVLIYIQNTDHNLNQPQYESEAGFNYLEDVEIFNSNLE